MRRATRALVLGVLLSVPAAHAAAWQPIAAGSPTWNPPVPYHLNQAGSVDLGGFDATLPEVQQAMGDWTRVSCTGLTMDYRGPTQATPGNYEGVATIGWHENSWRHGSSAIGVAGPQWSSSIIEADMELNGVHFTWTAGPGTFSNVNTYSIVLHEGGHYLGLGHSNVRGSSMWPSYSGGVVDLGPDDENGICALYPGSGPGGDCTVTGCPINQECIAGSCQTQSGDGSVCAPCDSHAQCGGSEDACLIYPDGQGYCAAACNDDSVCGPGGDCVGTQAGFQCIRRVEGQPSCSGGAPGGCIVDTDCADGQRCDAGTCVDAPTGGVAIGDPCTSDDMCNTGLCLVGTCTSSCDWTNPTGSCPGGFYCDGDSSNSCNSGFCVRGTPGGGALGNDCAADVDCTSLHCDNGRCSEPCIPDGAATCPSGYACQVGTLSCRGSCRRAGALGDACGTNNDCLSSICADRGEDDFCTRLCDNGNPCPAQFTCQEVGEVGVCVPDAGGLGAECDGNDGCLSGICAFEGSESYCTRVCDDDINPCSDGFSCVVTADNVTQVCQPTNAPGGCGCRAAGTPGSGGAWLALAAVGLLLRRRRR